LLGVSARSQGLYDADAQLLNASLADYLVPFASDVPNIRAVTLELAVAATTTNAVATALAPLGVDVRELPLTPARDLEGDKRETRWLSASEFKQSIPVAQAIAAIPASPRWCSNHN
jgi:hypothetical protein